MSDINSQTFVSPFLNFDAALLTNTNDQYLHVDNSDERSRFERSCCEIGGVVLVSGALGSVYGMIKGLNDPNIKTLPNRSIQRTQILNHITKTSGGIAQKCGIIGLIYAVCDSVIHKFTKRDDMVTRLTATTATGLLINSNGILTRGGWKKTIRGGVIGMFVGGAITLFSDFEQIKLFLKRSLKS